MPEHGTVEVLPEERRAVIVGGEILVAVDDDPFGPGEPAAPFATWRVEQDLGTAGLEAGVQAREVDVVVAHAGHAVVRGNEAVGEGGALSVIAPG